MKRVLPLFFLAAVLSALALTGSCSDDSGTDPFEPFVTATVGGDVEVAYSSTIIKVTDTTENINGNEKNWMTITSSMDKNSVRYEFYIQVFDVFGETGNYDLGAAKNVCRFTAGEKVYDNNVNGSITFTNVTLGEVEATFQFSAESESGESVTVESGVVDESEN